MNDDVVPSIQLEPSWKTRIGDYLLRPDMRELSAFLRQRKEEVSLLADGYRQLEQIIGSLETER